MIASNTAALSPRPLATRIAFYLTSIAILCIGLTATAHAQAVYTADRVDGLSAFGTFSRQNTDYGVDDYGYVVGADLTHSVGIRFLIPSLEVRYMGTTGPAITENSFLGGIKVETHLHRFHPYADFLIGYGIINYVKVNQNDNSIAYDAGVGVDFEITHQFAVKVDAQQQFWKLGQASNELEPQTISAGIVYHIPSFRHQ